MASRSPRCNIGGNGTAIEAGASRTSSQEGAIECEDAQFWEFSRPLVLHIRRQAGKPFQIIAPRDFRAGWRADGGAVWCWRQQAFREPAISVAGERRPRRTRRLRGRDRL